jgi:D-alanyl-lipoteichoic acid acyltransferase DltB (MBOAT superfamily)
MITMILGGLWHGASWNFIIWGLMHGIAILTHKIMRDNRFVKKLENKFPVSFSFSSLLLTQLFIFWTWLIFRLQDDNMLNVALKTSLGYNANFNWDIFNSSFSGPMYFHLLVLVPSFLIMHYMSYKYSGLKNVIAKLSPPKWALVTGIMLSLAILLKPVDTSDFIYFRF